MKLEDLEETHVDVGTTCETLPRSKFHDAIYLDLTLPLYTTYPGCVCALTSPHMTLEQRRNFALQGVDISVGTHLPLDRKTNDLLENK